jgi:uncharacterized protein
MNLDLLEAIRVNLLSPPALFFALGVTAALVRSDLKFPEALYTAMTIYLLVAIGFKGGVSMHEAGLASVLLPGLAALALGTLIPLWTYPILRYLGKLTSVDAASVAAHYGSVSAVTFTVAVNFLKDVGQPFEPYAAAFLAVMESPAIIVGILLGKMATRQKGDLGGSLRRALHEAVFGRSVLLLVGSLAIGFVCGERGMETTAGFLVTPFQGILALFLLELGTVAGRRLSDLRQVGLFLLAFGILMPLVHAFAGLTLGSLVGLSIGGATLLAVLAASASYIAAPAAMRLSLTEANPTLSLTAALVITFPFNVTLGIPVYYAVALWLFGGS